MPKGPSSVSLSLFKTGQPVIGMCSGKTGTGRYLEMAGQPPELSLETPGPRERFSKKQGAWLMRTTPGVHRSGNPKPWATKITGNPHSKSEAVLTSALQKWPLLGLGRGRPTTLSPQGEQCTLRAVSLSVLCVRLGRRDGPAPS